jgi:hypothetical protein
MLEQVKKTAINQAMKLMQHPTVMKLISNPHVQNAMTKGFELHSQIRTRMEGTLRTVGEVLHLTPKDTEQ